MAEFPRIGLVLTALTLTASASGMQAALPKPTWCDVIQQEPDPSVITDAQLRQKIVATGLPWKVRDKSTSIELLLVPPGSFNMGARSEDAMGRDCERPSHPVTISNPFYIGRTEVTQQQWIHVMRLNPSPFQRSLLQAAATASRESEVKKLLANGYTRREAESKVPQADADIPSTLEWPVELNSWGDLQAFLSKTGLSLPTEAQWEYACRAGNPAACYGELDAIGWCGSNSGDHPHAVATKSPNQLGLHDMIGNSWEWCADWFSPQEYSTPNAGSQDPVGPLSGESHVARGGNWLGLPSVCTAFSRTAGTDGRLFYGFRVARQP